MIWYDMIWYYMIWYDMIWYDMIWYQMISDGMIWYVIIFWHSCRMGVLKKCRSYICSWLFILSVLLLLLILQGISRSPRTLPNSTSRIRSEKTIQSVSKQEDRRQRLARVCEEHKGKTRTDLTWNRFYYEPASNVLYCRIFKAASTTYSALYSRCSLIFIQN